MNKYIIPLYVFLIFFLGIYSYALVDPNITFIQSPLWIQFREYAVQLGYYQRELSWVLYVCITILLFTAHFYFIKRFKHINGIHFALGIAIILLFSYPFLSHDLFNYMFDAKIFTFYGKNPYFFKALDFPADQWTRFMHWTHRTYPYGPVFLVLSFIPSFFGFGKFAFTFLLFKGLFSFFYVISVVLLTRLNKKWGVIFATHPLILIEGLVSSHNDLVALGLGLIGIYLLQKKTKTYWSRIFLLLSAGIKYTTFPFVLLKGTKPESKKIFKGFSFIVRNWNVLILIVQLGVLVYLSSMMGIQPWYFLSLFVFLPFFPQLLSQFNIFFFGLLMSYYPYIRLGGWDTSEKVNFRHQIIIFFAVLNILCVIFLYLFRRFKSFKNIRDISN